MGLFSKLQNGDTVLKSLKFGNDRPGGGNSGQPYIQDPIPLNNTPASADFILRGGINASKSAAQDVARLTKYMFNPKSPSGLLFTAKQNLLSRTSPKTETSKGLGYAGGALNNGVYSPLSTLAQAGVGFLGGHLNKQGLDPTGLLSFLSIKKYENVIKDQEKDENRLINILSNSTKNLNGVRGYDVNQGQDIITYNGGPGSTLGIGKTHIRYADQRTGINSIQYLNSTHVTNNQFQLPLNTSIKYNDYISSYSDDYVNYDLINEGLDSYQENIINNVYKSGSLESQPLTLNVYNNYKTWTQEDIVKESKNLGENGSGIRQDFRERLRPSGAPQKSFLSISPNYTEYNIEKNFNLGNPGQKGDISDYSIGKKDLQGNTIGPLDKINASFIYKSEGKGQSEAQSEYAVRGDELKDIIPFYIAILNNDRQEIGKTNTYKKYMHFRAFIDSFSDSYNAEWKSMEYMGRAEKFYKYGGFDRKIDLSFTVVAQSRQEINGMYDKLNFLASSLAPEYLDSYSSGYMAGNIAYITLGQYINEQPGIIDSLTFDIPEESPWEISLPSFNNEFTDSENIDEIRQVPHMIKVKMNFTPIHKFRVEKQRFTNDTLGTDSTRLLSTGNQRYLDQLRTKFTNYDIQKVTNSTIIPPLEFENDNTLIEVSPEIFSDQT